MSRNLDYFSLIAKTRYLEPTNGIVVMEFIQALQKMSNTLIQNPSTDFIMQTMLIEFDRRIRRDIDKLLLGGTDESIHSEMQGEED